MSTLQRRRHTARTGRSVWSQPSGVKRCPSVQNMTAERGCRLRRKVLMQSQRHRGPQAECVILFSNMETAMRGIHEGGFQYVSCPSSRGHRQSLLRRRPPCLCQSCVKRRCFTSKFVDKCPYPLLPLTGCVSHFETR